MSGGRRGPRHSRTLQAPQRLLVLSGRETGAGIDCACVQGKQQRRLQEGLQVRGFNEEPPTLRSRGADHILWAVSIRSEYLRSACRRRAYAWRRRSSLRVARPRPPPPRGPPSPAAEPRGVPARGPPGWRPANSRAAGGRKSSTTVDTATRWRSGETVSGTPQAASFFLCLSACFLVA